jgi:hypothetical protein
VSKLKSALCAVGLGAAIASAPAAALSWFSPVTAFEDDDLDYVFDNDGSGTLTKGDRLVSVIEWNETHGILANQGPDSILPGELTGVADITILTVLADGTFVFGATNDGSGEEGLLSGFADGTAVAIWNDSSPDMNVINSSCGTRAQCIELAGLGSAETDDPLWLTAGFFGDPDESWAATASGGGGTIATVQTGGATAEFGSFTYSLSVGINNTGKVLGQQSCSPFCGPGGNGLIDVIGGGNILGGQGLDADEWTARSDADFQLVPLPEPGSLALFGVALAAVGFIRRRK